MTTQKSLLKLLADGQVHSGEELARSLGLSRAAVWKQIRQLDNLQLSVHGQAGQGYQLERPIEFLSRQAIAHALDPVVRDAMEELHVLWATESTSDYLAQQSLPVPSQFQACVAEYQSAGRGRRGRQWFAPFGDGICLSLSYSFASSPPSLAALGLAVGVGMLRALRLCGATDIKLKWPNDIMAAGEKLSGILLDVQGEASGPLRVICGVGINYYLSDDVAQKILAAGGIRPAALKSDTESGVPGRSLVVARVMEEIYRVLTEFERTGFAAFADEWQSADFLAGKQVTVATDSGTVVGVATGLADDGALQISTDQGISHLHSGDVSVRASE